MASFVPKVLSTSDLHPIDVIRSGLREDHSFLPPSREVKSAIPGLHAEILNCPFGELPGRPFTCQSNGPMDALAIHHNVHAITNIAISKALCDYAVFTQGLAG